MKSVETLSFQNVAMFVRNYFIWLELEWCAAVYIHKCGPFHWNTWFGSLVTFFHFVCLMEQQYYKNVFLQILSKSCTVTVNLGERFTKLDLEHM